MHLYIYIVYKYIYTYILCFIKIELYKREGNRGKTEI